MMVKLHIHYYTNFGERICINYAENPRNGKNYTISQEKEQVEHIFKEQNNGNLKRIYLNYTNNGFWTGEFNIDEEGIEEHTHNTNNRNSIESPKRGTTSKEIIYYYSVLDKNNNEIRREEGILHKLKTKKDIAGYDIHDAWQVEPEFPFMGTLPFTNCILKYNIPDKEPDYSKGKIIFKVSVSYLPKGFNVFICGEDPFLGIWNPQKAIPLNPCGYPEWAGSTDFHNIKNGSNYKFLLKNDKGIQIWENGEPRKFKTENASANTLTIIAGAVFNLSIAPWKGAGTAIPLFSLRSEKSAGCGDFDDLKMMAEWAASTGQKIIQLLPVNDTILSGDNHDSYPYNCISVNALNPVYFSFRDYNMDNDFEEERKILNDKKSINFPKLLRFKCRYITKIYDETGEQMIQTDSFKTFFHNHKDWLEPYACFCFLKSEKAASHTTGAFKGYDFLSLFNDSKKKYSPDLIKKLFKTKKKEINFYIFIQYILHLQLKRAKEYAHSLGITLKGDIPIGVCKYSVETWQHPELFKMETSIGAPPDIFSKTGQNWGFPAYNWENIAKHGYKWWTGRMKNMSEYFDAFRIDHLLGFFRIWEIPRNAVRGLSGKFNYAIPYTVDEMKKSGFIFQKWMYEPFIDRNIIDELFCDDAANILNKFFVVTPDGKIAFKEKFNSETKLRDYFYPVDIDYKDIILQKLYTLMENVLFIKDGNNENSYHPRILGDKTYSYKLLNDSQREIYNNIYEDYFYYRSINYWKNMATEKLSVILNSTKMLRCGEDLGMIPSCVPEVMQQLNILSLEIQRMPKTFGVQFENLNDIPYTSVCTTSTHDISPIRLWWEENKAVRTNFYRTVLWKNGDVPDICTPEIAEMIIRNHLSCSAMWIILPLQDWMAIDKNIWNDDIREERINVPDNPDNVWKYRMHLNLEDLLKRSTFNRKIKTLITGAGR